MTCVSKECAIKTKMVQEQWLQQKMMFYRVITWNFLFSEEENQLLVRRGQRFGGSREKESTVGNFSRQGSGMSKSLAGQGIPVKRNVNEQV